ncbi:unnamed protein product [Owenia fusiformis]|uniref:Uncharacterized protein n=1 Tax=Owenia fusiformis TaxID=6347 RepID=A0A8J1XXC4_OWEFU|nr:unnamed protein product [Owenia fusiformis]
METWSSNSSNIGGMDDRIRDLDKLYAFILTLVIIISILGNILVMLVIKVNKTLHTTTSAFVFNLAVCDICLAVFVIPFSVITLLYDREWMLGTIMCNIVAYLSVQCCVSSIMSLTMISLERHTAINYPLKSTSLLTKQRVGYLIVFIWIFGAIFACMGFTPLGPYGFSPGKANCAPLPYSIPLLTLAVCLPMFTMLVMYIGISRTAMKQAKKGTLVCDANNCRFVSNKKGEMKAVKTLCIITGVFFLCWAPFVIVNMISLSHNISYNMDSVTQWLPFLSTSLNPWMYSLLNRSFKRGMKKQWRKVKDRFRSMKVKPAENSVEENATELKTKARPTLTPVTNLHEKKNAELSSPSKDKSKTGKQAGIKVKEIEADNVTNINIISDGKLEC